MEFVFIIYTSYYEKKHINYPIGIFNNEKDAKKALLIEILDHINYDTYIDNNLNPNIIKHNLKPGVLIKKFTPCYGYGTNNDYIYSINKYKMNSLFNNDDNNDNKVIKYNFGKLNEYIIKFFEDHYIKKTNYDDEYIKKIEIFYPVFDTSEKTYIDKYIKPSELFELWKNNIPNDLFSFFEY